MQVPIVPKSPAQLEPVNSQPVCFAHGGFALAGASNESRVHVWDATDGELLLSLDHGG